MPGEIALAALTIAILANAVLMAVVLMFAVWHRGPIASVVRRLARRGGDVSARENAWDGLPGPPGTSGRSASAGPSPHDPTRPRAGRRGLDVAAHRSMRAGDVDLDDVLNGTSAGGAYNKTVRIVTWAFIIACLVFVSATDLWKSTRPQIIVVLALAGIFVLVVHEVMPPTRLNTTRFVLEGTAAVVFLSLLVHLTGSTMSPFFFAFPLLVGAAALVATPGVTLVLTCEAALAYVVAALDRPGADERQVVAYTAINLTALVLLAYAGLVISREQRRTRDAAIRLSTVDSLTGLFNRAYFFASLEREIARSRRFRRDFSLLVMDVDGLKSVNDRYGHFQGDAMLTGAAEAIDEQLRQVDVAARYGGDEFAVLLPETDRDGAHVVAEKIRQAVASRTIEAAGQQIRASVSIGVVSFPDDGQTVDELMIAGDEAMYSSKRLGKNRVVAALGDEREAAAHRPAATPGFRPLTLERSDEAQRQ